MEELLVALGRDGELVGELLDHVAHAGHGCVDDQGLAAAVAQRADAEQQRAVARVEGHVDLVVHAVGGGAGRDQVGDEHGIVEPVERQVGAGCEHADDAAQDGADEGS